MGMLSGKKERLGEEMHKDECDSGGWLRCSEENMEVCQEGHKDYGYKGENDAGPLCLEEILLGVRPVIARMPDVKRI